MVRRIFCLDFIIGFYCISFLTFKSIVVWQMDGKFLCAILNKKMCTSGPFSWGVTAECKITDLIDFLQRIYKNLKMFYNKQYLIIVLLILIPLLRSFVVWFKLLLAYLIWFIKCKKCVIWVTWRKPLNSLIRSRLIRKMEKKCIRTNIDY